MSAIAADGRRNFCAMALLERRPHLDRIRQRFDSITATGGGACVVVSGEAGIGKTSLMRAVVHDLPAGTQGLWAGCEALFTPRPLGPLIDLATHFPPSIERALHEGRTYNGLFPALLRCLGDARRARVLVIEDLQWADVGTIDFVRYLGRRIHDLPLLLLLSHRIEGIDAAHPLRHALGDLPADSTLRVTLPPLSREAVCQLAAGTPRSPAEVFSVTGGNPFYVTELLASPDAQVPHSVRDAVLSTLARLSPPARALARAVSLVPRHADLQLLERYAAPERDAIDECLRAAILVSHDRALAFRHEIARNAVHDAMSPHERTRSHAAVWRAWCELASSDEHGAHRLHHAEAAGLLAEAAALAPLAARRASTTGDHREAARLYRLAIDATPDLADDTRAPLLEALADEWALTNQHRDAIDAREQALAIHRARGDRLREGINQRWLARLHWFESGGHGPGLAWARKAIETLATLVPPRSPRSLPPDGDVSSFGRPGTTDGPTRELALAYSTMSHLCLVREDTDGATTWGLHAIEIAEDVDDAEVMCHALNSVACAILAQHDDVLAWERLERSLSLAREHRFTLDVARALHNLFVFSVFHHDFARAWSWARQGLDHSEAQGLDVYAVRTLIRRALAHTLISQWSQAKADLAEVTRRFAPSPVEAATHGFVSNLLAMRQGEPGSTARLRQTVGAMLHREVEIGAISTAAAALAEAAWLDGDHKALVAAARPGLEAMVGAGCRWRVGELAAWLRRADADVDVAALPPLPKPYALELNDQPNEAAHEWQRLGRPYDAALALCGGDIDALTDALLRFEQMGAKAAAARVRERLRERGARNVPRGPMPRTRDDPLNLTARERQIFELLSDGATNAAIAAKLHRSERTVEHHVSALLRKLGVRNRVELLARHQGE